MPRNRYSIFFFLGLIIIINACRKKNEHHDIPGPGSNPGPVNQPDTLHKRHLVGWWRTTKWAYTDNTLRYVTIYFGADSFAYTDRPGNYRLGASTGKWWWTGKDSVKMVLTAGWGLTEATIKITALTHDTLQYRVDGFPGDYLRLDSAPISSRPIATIAGNGASGFTGDNGPALEARFAWPNGTAVDAAGNIYVSVQLANSIRKITVSDGKITTIAGSIEGYGGDGGLAKDAFLDDPNDIKVDQSGNLFIVDTKNNCIRKVSAVDGTISTIVGKYRANNYPYYGGDNGPAKDALLYTPWSIAIDASGNIYVSDKGNNRVRKVDAVTGIITTIAGNGTYGSSGDNGLATQAQIRPGYIALDATGENLYIGDNWYQIRKVSLTTGIITTVAGTGTQGYNGEGRDALQSSLGMITGLAVDKNNNIYFSQANPDHRYMYIRKISAIDNTIKTVAGSGGDLINGFKGYSGDGIHATAFLLNWPCGISFDNNGHLIIADRDNERIRMLDIE